MTITPPDRHFNVAGIWQRLILRSLMPVALVLSLCSPALAQKMKLEELMAKHLDAIAPAEVRAQLSSRVVAGTVLAVFRLGGSGQAEGEARLAFQGPKTLIAMLFGQLEYPFEKVAFDGSELRVSQLKPGVRSQLCQFLNIHDDIFQAGLMTGALSTGWALLDPSYRGAKLQYAGMRRIDNRQMHEVRVRPKQGTDFQISLYFEDGTFRHVRTQYRMTVSASMGARPEDSAQQRETRNQLVEDFSDFRPESQWVLPHQYKIQLTLEGQARTILSDWSLTLTKFDFSVPLANTDFVITN